MSLEQKNIEFVQEIEKHPCLYNYKLSDYMRKDVTDRTWVEIGNKFQITGPEAKEKWKNLRSVFVRHLKPPRSGSATAQKKPYYLTDYMQFALPFIKPAAKPLGNLKETNNAPSINRDGTESFKWEQTQFTESMPTSSSTSISQQHSYLPSSDSQSISQQQSSLPSSDSQSISQQHSSLPSSDSQSISQQHSSLPSSESQSISQQHSSLPSSDSQSISQQHSSLPPSDSQSISQQHSSLPSSGYQSILAQQSFLPSTSTQSMQSPLPLPSQSQPATSTKKKRKQPPEQETQSERDISSYFKMKQSKLTDDCGTTTNSNKMFLLSLVSDMNKMTDNQRRFFKRKVLELVDNIMDQSNEVVISPVTETHNAQSQNTATFYYESLPVFLSEQSEKQ